MRPPIANCVVSPIGPRRNAAVLFKSMAKHLRHVREDFPAELPDDPLHPARGPGADAGGAATPADLVRRPTQRDTTSDPGSSA